MSRNAADEALKSFVDQAKILLRGSRQLNKEKKKASPDDAAILAGLIARLDDLDKVPKAAPTELYPLPPIGALFNLRTPAAVLAAVGRCQWTYFQNSESLAMLAHKVSGNQSLGVMRFQPQISALTRSSYTAEDRRELTADRVAKSGMREAYSQLAALVAGYYRSSSEDPRERASQKLKIFTSLVVDGRMPTPTEVPEDGYLASGVIMKRQGVFVGDGFTKAVLEGALIDYAKGIRGMVSPSGVLSKQDRQQALKSAYIAILKNSVAFQFNAEKYEELREKHAGEPKDGPGHAEAAHIEAPHSSPKPAKKAQ